MAKRKAISKRVRFNIFKRDRFTCQYCGAHPPGVLLHIDHIHPVAEGGTNDDDNLITACEPCNLGKGAGLLNDVPKSLAQKAEELAEIEEQLKGYQTIHRAQRQRLDDESWEVADVYMDHFKTESILKSDRQSIKAFIEKLGVVEVLSAMEKAVATKPSSAYSSFKYFCGICWNKVRSKAEGGQIGN